MSTEREIYIYNTLTRRKERFEPRTPGRGEHLCLRRDALRSTPISATPVPAFSLMFYRNSSERWASGSRLVQNFTDVDDKIIDRARERGMEPLELARHYSEAYLEAWTAWASSGPTSIPRFRSTLTTSSR